MTIESKPIGGTFTLMDPRAGQSEPIPFDASEEEIAEMVRRLTDDGNDCVLPEVGE